jgi:hypothetical protein
MARTSRVGIKSGLGVVEIASSRHARARSEHLLTRKKRLHINNMRVSADPRVKPEDDDSALRSRVILFAVWYHSLARAHDVKFRK